jgi:HK97 family phage prohead protease
MQNRAYSLLTVKAMDDDARTFSGVATTPSVDRVGDIIDPLGVKFTNPLPLLHQHKHDKPIGKVWFEKPTKDGIKFRAEIPKIDEPGELQDRVNTAWGEIKYGLVTATSIGFRPIEYSFMENGGVRYSETEVFELSAVTIPAQADAIISQIKSIDAQLRAAEGVPEPETPANPTDTAATGKVVRVVKLGQPARVGAPFVIQSIKRVPR